MGRIEPSIGTSISCLSSEAMVDRAYGGLLAALKLVEVDKETDKIMVEVNDGGRNKDMNVFLPLKDGIYIPGSERNYWCGYFDFAVDSPPGSGTVIIDSESPIQFEYVSIKRIKRLPPRAFTQCKRPQLFYKAFRTYISEDPKEWPFVDISFFVIDADGYAWTTLDSGKFRKQICNPAWSLSREEEIAEHFGPGALSLLADRRYLWNVRTSEPWGTLGNTAKVDFGIEEEMIKSLLYARKAPRTDTGRLRPILHWVSSHKRRLSTGIDIDVRKHLRGVTSFEMDGMNFEITEPEKQTGRA